MVLHAGLVWRGISMPPYSEPLLRPSEERERPLAA
jgi:hypothetical protein